MGIPTGGPQQGRTPSRGGIPTGNKPGNQQPSQQRPRAGIPKQQQSTEPPRRRAEEEELPLANPEIPSRASQRPPLSSETQRRLSERRSKALPPAADNEFDDRYSFKEDQEDLFSDVPNYKDEPDTSLDFEDDGTFEPISAEDSFEDEDNDGYNQEREAEEKSRNQAQERKAPTPAAKPRRARGVSKPPVSSSNEGSDGEEFSDEFVDKDNLKLKPFGSGKKPKKKATVGDFDARKNMESKRKLYRGIVLFTVITIIGFGAFKTFAPQTILDRQDVQVEIADYVGDTGFPTTEGEGFALGFMDSVLNVQPGANAIATRSAALSYFYGNTSDSKDADSAITMIGDIKQEVIRGPVVLDSTAITANAASYEIGFLVKTADSNVKIKDDSGAEAQIAESLRWMAFNVNVYYDDVKQSFAIAPNSPSLIPAPPVVAPGNIPEGQSLGDSIEEVPESVKATVEGFLSGYRESSKDNTDKILQYIGTEADESLRDGLNSRYQFATPEDLPSSISYDVYSPSGASDLSVLKIDLTVEWKITASSNASVTFPSHYVLTLEDKGSGDYTVTKFAPYYWIESSEDPTE